MTSSKMDSRDQLKINSANSVKIRHHINRRNLEITTLTYEEEGSEQYKKLDRSKIWDQSKTTARLIVGLISTHRRSQ